MVIIIFRVIISPCHEFITSLNVNLKIDILTDCVLTCYSFASQRLNNKFRIAFTSFLSTMTTRVKSFTLKSNL